MADKPRDLFDFGALARRRARASGEADFLHRAMADSLADRLGDVPRAFARAALVGAPAPVAAMLAERGSAVDAFDPAAPAARRLTGETLPVAEGAYDLAVSAGLMHHLNDPVGHLVQLRRALKPDGLVLAALFGGQTLRELRAAFAEAEAAILGGLTPRVAPMAEIRDLGGLLQRAGLAMPVADSEKLTVTYASPLDLMRDLRAMGETNVLSDRARRPLRRDVLARMAEVYHVHFPAEEGRVRATFEIVYLTGWAPGPDQPRPLRPGSAKTRLAEALKTVEIPTGEKPGQ